MGVGGEAVRFEVHNYSSSGSFNLKFLGKHITMAYQNLSNVIVR